MEVSASLSITATFSSYSGLLLCVFKQLELTKDFGGKIITVSKEKQALKDLTIFPTWSRNKSLVAIRAAISFIIHSLLQHFFILIFFFK